MAINNNIDVGRLEYLLTLQAYTIDAIDKKLITPQFGAKFLTIFNGEARKHIGQEMVGAGQFPAIGTVLTGEEHVERTEP